MLLLNHIEGKDLAQLSPLQFVELLKRLLHSEALVRGIAQHGIHVSSAISVADGGEDGRWKAPLKPSEYIPNPFTVYQIKAEEISPADCAAEVVKRGQLKQMVREVLEARGCYCFFCSYRYKPVQIKKRLEAARKAIAAVDPQFSNPSLAFLDADQIAEWTNQHLSTVTFVQTCLRRATNASMRHWRSWAGDPEIVEHPFQTNAYLNAHLTTVRDLLKSPKQIVRVFGLSGVGKSRLVFEALRPMASQTGQDASLSAVAVYLDLSTSPDGKIEAVQRIAESGMSGIVVVDNCSPTHHAVLERSARHTQAQFTLVTIDFEEQKLPSSSVHAIELKPAQMADIIPKILRAVPEFRTLTDPQIEAVASYSQGFPQIAVLMAKQKAALTFEQLSESKFAEKLLWGREPQDNEALEILKTLAAFSHVGVEGDVANQLAFIRERLCGLPSDEALHRKMERFRKLRIVQPVGKYWVIAPRPLAVALAALWWEGARASTIRDLLRDLEPIKLLQPFGEQLRLLQFSNRLTELGAELCGPTGPFGQAEVLFSPAGSQLFRCLCEINPQSALDALHRLVDLRTVADLRKIDGVTRRNLVWALEKLCWPAAQFPRAAALLLKFAASENEKWSNNASGQLQQLYHAILSGTQQPAMARLPVLEDALRDGEPECQVSAVKALGHALHVGTFTRMSGVEVRGSALPEEDWHPTKWDEIWDYQVAAFKLLTRIARESSTLAELARATAGRHLRTVVAPSMIDRVTSDIEAIAAAAHGYWPEARESLETAIDHDAERNPPLLEKLRRLLTLLAPTAVADRVKQFVTVANYRTKETADGQFVDLSAQNAYDLGAELGKAWSDHPALRLAFEGGQNKAYHFGQGLASTVSDPDSFISWAFESLRQLPPASRNPSLLAGFFSAVSPELFNQTLATVAQDPELKVFYVTFARSKPLTAEHLRAVISLMAQGSLPPELLVELSHGKATEAIPTKELMDLLIPLARSQPEAIGPVYALLSMHIYGNDAAWQDARDGMRVLMLSPTFLENLREGDSHAWERHIHSLLEPGTDQELAITIARQIVALAMKDGGDRRETMDRRVLALLFERYGAAVWPIVGDGLLGRSAYRVSSFLAENGSHFDVTNQIQESFFSPFWMLDENLALAWLKAHPQAIPFVFNSVPLFAMDENGGAHWHPLMLTLMQELFQPDHDSEIGANLWSFASTGSRRPYITRRIALLQQLRAGKNPALKKMAQRWIEQFEKDLMEQVSEDQEFAAGIL